jgi:hypothetical protein
MICSIRVIYTNSNFLKINLILQLIKVLFISKIIITLIVDYSKMNLIQYSLIIIKYSLIKPTINFFDLKLSFVIINLININFL